MKAFLFSMIFALLAVVCEAQDVIVTKDSKHIKVPVTQVTKDGVRYENYDNIDGLTYNIPVGKVSYIRYEDGAIDRFDDEQEEEDDYKLARCPASTSTAHSTSQTRNNDDYYATRTTTRSIATTRASSSQLYYDDGYSRQRRSQPTETDWYNEPVRNSSQWSLRAGLNYNTFYEGLGTGIGFNFGILGEFPSINDFLYFQTGLLLNNKNAKGTVESEDEDNGYKKYPSSINIYELQLPFYLTLGFYLSDESNIRLKFHAGPTIGLGLSAKYNYEQETLSGKRYEVSQDLYDKNGYNGVKRVNFSLTIGGGFQFDHFYIGIVNDFDVLDGIILLKPDIQWNKQSINLKTNSLMVNLGYSF